MKQAPTETQLRVCEDNVCFIVNASKIDDVSSAGDPELEWSSLFFLSRVGVVVLRHAAI